jgi:hypothetical protein
MICAQSARSAPILRFAMTHMLIGAAPGISRAEGNGHSSGVSSADWKHYFLPSIIVYFGTGLLC